MCLSTTIVAAKNIFCGFFFGLIPGMKNHMYIDHWGQKSVALVWYSSKCELAGYIIFCGWNLYMVPSKHLSYPKLLLRIY